MTNNNNNNNPWTKDFRAAAGGQQGGDSAASLAPAVPPPLAPPVPRDPPGPPWGRGGDGVRGGPIPAELGGQDRAPVPPWAPLRSELHSRPTDRHTAHADRQTALPGRARLRLRPLLLGSCDDFFWPAGQGEGSSPSLTHCQTWSLSLASIHTGNTLSGFQPYSSF